MVHYPKQSRSMDGEHQAFTNESVEFWSGILFEVQLENTLKYFGILEACAWRSVELPLGEVSSEAKDDLVFLVVKFSFFESHGAAGARRITFQKLPERWNMSVKDERERF